jgi:hypothetical protein
MRHGHNRPRSWRMQRSALVKSTGPEGLSFFKGRADQPARRSLRGAVSSDVWPYTSPAIAIELSPSRPATALM